MFSDLFQIYLKRENLFSVLSSLMKIYFLFFPLLKENPVINNIFPLFMFIHKCILAITNNKYAQEKNIHYLKS